MDKIDTLQNSIHLISNRVDAIETNIDNHLLLLIAILALVVATVGYFIVSEILYWRKTKVEKKKRNLGAGSDEQKSSIDKFIKILPNLTLELEKMQSYKIKADEFDSLEKNFNKVTNEKQSLSEQKQHFEIEIQKYQNKMQEKDKEFSNKIRDIEENCKPIKQLLEKVKKVDVLKDYSGKVSDYLLFFENILKDLNEKILRTDLETAKIVSALLQQALSSTTELAKWKYICNDITENDILVQNKDLKNCFQSNQESEHLFAYKSLYISKLRHITNAFLILCEAISNLSRFTNNTNLISIEHDFKNKIFEIREKAKEIGIIEIADVKLFSKLVDYEAVSGNIKYPYTEVKNLNKDDIAEIVEFGMRTEFDEKSKTKVLIY